MSYVAITCCLTLAVTFAVSAWGKVRDRAQFGAFVSSTRRLQPRFLPPSGATPVAAVVLGTELALPALLAAVPRAGCAVAAVLLAAFAVALAGAARRGVRQPCRCLGASSTPIGYPHVVRAAALAALALLGLVASGRPGNTFTGPVLLARAHPAGVVVAIAVATLLAALTIRFDDVSALYTALPEPAAGIRHMERN